MRCTSADASSRAIASVIKTVQGMLIKVPPALSGSYDLPSESQSPIIQAAAAHMCMEYAWNMHGSFFFLSLSLSLSIYIYIDCFARRYYNKC